MQRLRQIATHLANTPSGVAALQEKHPSDVVITMAIRSPLTKSKGGAFKDTPVDALMLEMFKQVNEHSQIDPSSMGDICVGTVLTPRPVFHARAAALAAGIPETVPIQVINRFCSSGLMAVNVIANEILAGQIEIGLAMGFESMSQNPDPGAPPQADVVNANAKAKDCLFPMGWTSENVAEDFNISRDVMDAFAAESFRRAEHAEKSGLFAKEIVPFTVYVNDHDPETGITSRRRVIVTKDEGIRYGTTKESLLKIRSAFPQWGQAKTTGGNASQITDGAAAVLLMTRRKAEALGLPILGKYVNTAVAGCAPRVMGIGPIYAIPMVLKNTGITIEDVDLFEINEAFASQCVYCVQALGLDHKKVNVNGGAIAFGHPLDKSSFSFPFLPPADWNMLLLRCSGARQIATGLHELQRRGGKVLVTSMCIGTGMGAAAVFVRDA